MYTCTGSIFHKRITINNVYFMQSESGLCGIDWNGPLPELEQVVVTNTVNPLQGHDFMQLQRVISPISPSDCQGVDLYVVEHLNLYSRNLLNNFCCYLLTVLHQIS